MNKRKKWIIAAIILVSAGVLICGITFAAAGFDLGILGNSDYITKTFEINEEFHDISIQTGTDDIALKPSEDGKCTVVCIEKDGEEHEVLVEDGMLLINGKDPMSWFNFSIFDFQEPSVTVYLPEKEYGLLMADAGTGSIQIPEELAFDEIRAQISTGTIRNYASARNAVELKATTGDIIAEGFGAGDIILSVTTGDIRGTSLQSQGKVDAHVTTGDTKLESITCKDLFSEGSTGTLNLKNAVASGEIHIERSTGDINLDACDAASLYMKTSTGDITGTLLSDKVFLTSTGTGDVNVPQTIEGGKCEIITGTGDINIRIE